MKPFVFSYLAHIRIQIEALEMSFWHAANGIQSREIVVLLGIKEMVLLDCGRVSELSVDG